MDSNSLQSQNEELIKNESNDNEDMGLIVRSLPSNEARHQTSNVQVPVFKILEVLTQSMHEKEKENRQLKDKCMQLEQKLSTKFFAGKSEEMLLDLRRQSAVVAKSTEITHQSPATRASSGSTARSPLGQKIIEDKSKSPTKQFSLECPRKSPRELKLLSRAKSEPFRTKKNLLEGTRKSSHPEVFLFPDTTCVTKRTDTGNMANHNIKARTCSSGEVSVDGDRNDAEGFEDPGEFEGLEDGFQELPGVSAVYFNNVINELMLTKTILHNLQQKDMTKGVGEMEMEKMRTEIQQLRIQNTELQRALDEKEKELSKSTATKGLTKENSFELHHPKDTEEQGLSEVEILRLKTENEELKGKIRVLNAEKERLHYRVESEPKTVKEQLTCLTEEYDKQRNTMKILTKCLSEEKARSKTIEDRLKIKTEESKKLSSQLGSLRQKYEELQQEKNALEKERKLERSRSKPYNIRPDDHMGPNILSGKEAKPSNVSLMCPRCFQMFHVEKAYLVHMEKCLE